MSSRSIDLNNSLAVGDSQVSAAKEMYDYYPTQLEIKINSFKSLLNEYLANQKTMSKLEQETFKFAKYAIEYHTQYFAGFSEFLSTHFGHVKDIKENSKLIKQLEDQRKIFTNNPVKTIIEPLEFYVLEIGKHSQERVVDLNVGKVSVPADNRYFSKVFNSVKARTSNQLPWDEFDKLKNEIKSLEIIINGIIGKLNTIISAHSKLSDGSEHAGVDAALKGTHLITDPRKSSASEEKSVLSDPIRGLSRTHSYSRGS